MSKWRMHTEQEDTEYIVQGGHLWIVGESWIWIDGRLPDTAMLSPSLDLVGLELY